RPVLGVALGEVVGRGDRVLRDRRGLRQRDLRPRRRVPGQPLRVRGAVDEVRHHLATRGVLAAGAGLGHLAADVAGDGGAVRAVHAGRAWLARRVGVDRVGPRRLDVTRLEGGREVGGKSVFGGGRRGGGKGDQAGGDHGG